jgi:hypothetical protein
MASRMHVINKFRREKIVEWLTEINATHIKPKYGPLEKTLWNRLNYGAL